MHGANGSHADLLRAAPFTLGAWERFYASASAPHPVLEPLAGSAVPEPQRTLLVHNGDMTPALESFHRGSIHLEVLRSRLDGDYYERDVVLHMDGSSLPVEFGVIEINLAAVTAPARAAILEGHKPLGAILRDFKVAHLSRPKAYFSVECDKLIGGYLKLAEKRTLFGRRNTLLAPDGRTLAEIVEILPP